MALGADNAKVVRMVVKGAMAQLVLGLLVGIPVALAGERTLAHQLFEVKSYAPVVMRAAVLLLAISRRSRGVNQSDGGAADRVNNGEGIATGIIPEYNLLQPA